MRKTFDAELQELNYEMIDMAAAAEDAIDVVTESLASGDDAAAKSAVEMTRSMDQMERDIENRCLQPAPPAAAPCPGSAHHLGGHENGHRSTAHRRPVRQHRRDLPAAQGAEADPGTLADIRTMSQKAGVMVKRSIFAYVNRDTEAARLSLPWTTRWTPSSAPSRGSWWSSLQATGTRPTRPSTSSLSPSTWSASPDHAVNIAQWPSSV